MVSKSSVGIATVDEGLRGQFQDPVFMSKLASTFETVAPSSKPAPNMGMNVT
jgi:hypothetical protein